MKFKTVIDRRVPLRRPKHSRLITVVVLVVNTVSTVILPFSIGFYFARSGNFLFFVAFLFLLIFEFRLEYHKDTIKFKFTRAF